MNWWLSLFTTALMSWGYWAIMIVVPGWLLTRPVRMIASLRWPFVVLVGFSVFATLSFLCFRLTGDYLFSDLLLFGLALYTLVKRPVLPPTLKKISGKVWLGILMVAIVLSVQAMVLWRSAIPTTEGVAFVELSLHDSMQHLAIIDRLAPGSQLSHPGYGGVEIRNYHYLIDVVLAATNRLAGVDLWQLYYRIYPLSVGIIVAATIIGATYYLTKSKVAAWMSYPLTVLMGNASPYLALIRGDEFRPSANALMMNPIVDIMQNPAATLILAIFLIYIALLHQAYRRRLGNPWLYILCLGILVGVSFSIKAWGGVVMGAILVIAAGLEVILVRRCALLCAGVLALLVLVATFFVNYDHSSAAGFSYAPFWLITKMVEDADRWNNLPELFQSQAYLYQKDWVGLIRLYSKWLAVFFVGNLSFRFLGLAAFGFWAFGSKYRTWGLVAIATLLISWPMLVLFNNSQMAYDIEQFAPYGLLLASLGLVYLYVRFLPSRLLLPALLVTIALGIPANFNSIKARTMGDLTTYTWNQLDSYNLISSIVPDGSIIALPPSGSTVATLAFSALTGKDTYFSGRTFSIITGHDWESRKKDLEGWFGDKRLDANDFETMRAEGIDHIYLNHQEASEIEFSSTQALRLPDGVLISLSSAN